MKQRVFEPWFSEAQITLDRKGSRTWESAKRAICKYHFDRVPRITGRFQAARALFLFRDLGIDASAFGGKNEAWGYWSFRSELREFLVRLKAVPLIAFWKLQFK